MVSNAPHSIRYTVDPLKSLLGSGPDAIVEIDETFVGGKVSNNMHRDKRKPLAERPS
jgi:hypothetical protein